MKKKIIIIVSILIIIVILWFSGIIPKKIAEVYGTYYLNKNFSKLQFEFVYVEWSPHHADYLIQFKDQNNQIYSFIIGPKYLPVYFGQGMYGFEEQYKERFE